MPNVDDYIDYFFTQRSLLVEHVHTNESHIYKMRIRDSTGAVVGSAIYRVEKHSIELYKLENTGYFTKSPIYKGIGKQILVLVAILARSLNIPTISFTAVPNAVGDNAQKLFDYYTMLGAVPIYKIYNEESWIQFFELSVDTFLEEEGVKGSQ
jgi:hypothetical protein